MAETKEVLHKGGCHCGAVRFQVLAPAVLKVCVCNCSVCTKKQNHHFIVPEAKFQLISGKEELTTYTFNTCTAKHTFCKVCGVQSFYTPRSNPDGKAVMPHCLDSGTVTSIMQENFDGQNWEYSIQTHPDIKNRSK